MVVIIVSCIVWAFVATLISGRMFESVISAIMVFGVAIVVYKDRKKYEAKYFKKDLQNEPDNLMLKKLQKIADETVNEVLQEYFRNSRDPKVKDNYEATVSHYFEDSFNETLRHLKGNIEGLCILVAIPRLPKDMMALRLAQFCGYINEALNRNELRPLTELEDLLMDYELLGLKDVYEINPELFCIDGSYLMHTESNAFKDGGEFETEACNADSYEDEFDYREIDEGIVLTKYKKHGDVVSIPKEIHGKIVIGIDGAFKDNEYIKKVKLNEGIRFIAPRSFQCAGNLVEIHFADSLVEIGEYAFAGCMKMNSLVLGKGISVIGKRAFLNCSSLYHVSINPPVTRIEEGVFESCTNLQSVSIGEGVIVLGDCAFSNCCCLSSISIPKRSLTYIGRSAFENCLYLECMDSCEGLQEIGDKAFKNCRRLLHFEFPENFRKLGENAFEGCFNLVSIDWYGDIEFNRHPAFKNCPSLKYRGFTKLNL